MVKRFLCVFLTMSVIFTVLSGCAEKTVTSADFTAEQLDSSVYDVEKYTTPFWEGNIVYNEFVFPMYNANAEVEPFPLMYEASEIVSVRDYSLSKTYVEGKDYTLENGKLVILPGSDIEVSGYSLIHREGVPEVLPDDLIINLNKDGTEFFDVYNRLIKKTIAVTYIHNDTWDCFTPDFDHKVVKNTVSKMKKGENTTIVVTGDSISVGYSASKVEDMPPYADSYVDMVLNALKKHYNNDKIELVNSSVGGSTAKFTDEILREQIVQHNPDLVIIALGVNDAMANRKTENYIADISGRIEYIKQSLPESEIIVLTPFFANPYIYDINYAKDYRAALYELVKQYDGVGICDPLGVNLDLFYKINKNYLSFASDNMVHQNDFGMRIIAQCVVAALSE